MKNLTKSKNHTNHKMNNDTYALRRKVMDVIYSAKTIAKLPRIDVRITNAVDANTLGSAYIKGNSIFITEKAIRRKDMTAIVLHEILHAVFGQEHVDSCPLMDAVASDCSDVKAFQLFKKYAK